jgi:hypothetical protein
MALVQTRPREPLPESGFNLRRPLLTTIPVVFGHSLEALADGRMISAIENIVAVWVYGAYVDCAPGWFGAKPKSRITTIPVEDDR